MLMNNVILLIDVACDEVGVGWDGVDGGRMDWGVIHFNAREIHWLSCTVVARKYRKAGTGEAWRSPTE